MDRNALTLNIHLNDTLVTVGNLYAEQPKMAEVLRIVLPRAAVILAERDAALALAAAITAFVEANPLPVQEAAA